MVQWPYKPLIKTWGYHRQQVRCWCMRNSWLLSDQRVFAAIITTKSWHWGNGRIGPIIRCPQVVWYVQIRKLGHPRLPWACYVGYRPHTLLPRASVGVPPHITLVMYGITQAQTEFHHVLYCVVRCTVWQRQNLAVTFTFLLTHIATVYWVIFLLLNSLQAKPLWITTGRPTKGTKRSFDLGPGREGGPRIWSPLHCM